MEELKISIASKEYTVKLAVTEEEHETGLQNIETLPENEGMLFIFEEPEHRDFWMVDTLIPLDIIFIDEDLNVISVKQGEPKSEEYISEDNAMYVLELNINSGVEKGDELEFISDKDVNNKMYIVGLDGNPQMELDGGERIFSRENTKILIKFAKKADATNNDNDYKALGKRVIKFINQQDERPAEYVEPKK